MAQRIGVDVGGTNVKIALVSDEGKIIYSNSIPTRAEMGYEYTVNSMKEAIRELLKETKLEAKDIEGMGFGFPGQIDCQKGIVRLAPNIPGWVNVPIAEIMEKEFGNLDDLDIVDLIMYVEDFYNIEFNDEEYESIHDVKKLCEIISDKIKKDFE